jgi:hypothetical protein
MYFILCLGLQTIESFYLGFHPSSLPKSRKTHSLIGSWVIELAAIL